MIVKERAAAKSARRSYGVYTKLLSRETLWRGQEGNPTAAHDRRDAGSGSQEGEFRFDRLGTVGSSLLVSSRARRGSDLPAVVIQAIVQVLTAFGGFATQFLPTRSELGAGSQVEGAPVAALAGPVAL